MKKTLTVVAILALAATLLPVAFAQTSDQTSPSAPAASSPAQTTPSPSEQPAATQGSASESPQAAESFTGIVVKSGNQYVLKTDTGTYQIDDQEKAKQFEGKQVKITGNLDKATGTLHVTDIQAAMQQ